MIWAERLRVSHGGQACSEPPDLPTNAGLEHDGGGDEWSRQGSTPDLVDSGDHEVIATPKRALGVERGSGDG